MDFDGLAASYSEMSLGAELGSTLLANLPFIEHAGTHVHNRVLVYAGSRSYLANPNLGTGSSCLA